MRLIDADALLERIENPYQYREVAAWVNDMPTIEPKKGKWIDMGDFEQCSACTGTHLKEVNTVYGKAIWIKSAYCPNCGLRMENGDDSN